MADSIDRLIASPPKIRIPSTADVYLTSTNHPFQIGPTEGVNMIMDNNQLMARNNGAWSSFSINEDQGDGGNVTISGPGATTRVRGALVEGYNHLTTRALNSVREGGRYIQTANANATAARNYPAARAGFLEVISNSLSGASGPNGTGGFIFQRYTDYQNKYIWQRTWYNNTWYPWRLITPVAGTVLVAMKANTVVSKKVNIPANTFPTGASVSVMLTAHTSAPNNVQEVGVSEVSRTGFTINAFRKTTQDTTVAWVAHQI